MGSISIDLKFILARTLFGDDDGGVDRSRRCFPPAKADRRARLDEHSNEEEERYGGRLKEVPVAARCRLFGTERS